MKPKTCVEFERWLDSLPAEPPGEEWRRHVLSCTDCREKYERLGPVVQALMEVPPPPGLDESTLREVAAAAERKRRGSFRGGPPFDWG